MSDSDDDGIEAITDGADAMNLAAGAGPTDPPTGERSLSSVLSNTDSSWSPSMWSPSTNDSDDLPAVPIVQRIIRCGVCGESGHNRRTCKFPLVSYLYQTLSNSDLVKEILDKV